MRRAFAVETFGADTRNDWFKIRGFDAQDVGLFQDGLQLFSFAFATWKFPPFGIERDRCSSRAFSGPVWRQRARWVGERDQQETALRAVETISKPASTRGVIVIVGLISAGRWATPFGPEQRIVNRLLGTVKGGGTQTHFTP